MGGAGEGGIRRLGIADPGIEGDIGVLVPHARRVRRGGRQRGGHRGQRLVIDIDEFGGIFCDRHRLGDDDGHRLADEARPVRRQRQMGRNELRRAVGIGELDVRLVSQHRTVRQRLQAIRLDILAGEHGDDAVERQRG